MFSTRLEEGSFYPIFDFLKKMHSDGTPVMLNDRIKHPMGLTNALTAAEKLLDTRDPEVRLFLIPFTSSSLHLLLEIQNSRRAPGVEVP